MRKTLINSAVLSALFVAGSASANVNVSGFGSLAYKANSVDSTQNFNRTDEDGAYVGPSVLGLQFNSSFNGIDLTGQFKLGEDVSADGRPAGSVQYLFAGMDLTDEVRVRAGRLRAPFYLNSETLDVGHVRLQAVNPLSVYSQAPFQNYNGVDATYNTEMGDYEMMLQVFGGSEEFDNRISADNSYRFKANYLLGANLEVIRDDWKVRAGYTIGEMDNVSDFDMPLAPGMSVDSVNVNNDSGSFLTLGVSYDDGEIVAQGEYAQRSVDDALMAVDNSGYYVTLGYRFGKVTPYYTYQSLTTADKNKEVGFNNGFKGQSLGVKYDHGQWSVQAEASRYELDENGMFGYSNMFNQYDSGAMPTPQDDSVTEYSVSINTTF